MPASVLDRLLEHLNHLSSDASGQLNPPATQERLQAWQAQFDFPLDPVLLEVYGRFDGENLGLARGVQFTPIERNLLFHRQPWMDWHSIADNRHLVKDQYYSRQRVPFAEDYGGSVWFLDYDPAPAGRAGQVICIFRDFPETVYYVAESLEAFLGLILAEFEAGRVTFSQGSLRFQAPNDNYSAWFLYQSALSRTSERAIPKHALGDMSDQWQNALASGQRNAAMGYYAPGDSSHWARTVKEISLSSASMLERWGDLEYFEALQFLTVSVHTDGAETLTLSADALKKLRDLPLTQVNINLGVESLFELAQLKLVQQLRVGVVRSNDLGPLANCPNLRSLEVQLERVPDLAWLSGMSALRELRLEFVDELPWLSETQVSQLCACPGLKHLTLRHCRFDHLEGFERSQTLESVTIYRRPISE